MSWRNRGLPPPIKGGPLGGFPPAVHEPPFSGRDLGPLPHPTLLEEMRESQFGLGPRPLPPHPDIIQERFAAQHQEIQGLLVDNQRLAATHVALKQELEAAHHELQRMTHIAESVRVDKEKQMRELYDKSVRLEVDLRGVEAMRAELLHVNADIKELTAAKQDLTGRVQLMTQDLNNMRADLQQIPAVKEEIDATKEGLQRAIAAIKYEKKGHAENYEHGQAMEKKLISMARELEKLQVEKANADKHVRAAAVVANPGAGYNPYPPSNAEVGYGGNPYPPSNAEAGYAVNPYPPNHMGHVPMENYPQYGPGPGTWGAYDMQRAQGNR